MMDPADIAAAYDAQDKLVGSLVAGGQGAIAGYKIGLTTPRMQRMCNIDHPIAGAVLAGRVHRSPATVGMSDFVHLGIECELAVRLARSLPGDRAASREAVAACIGEIAPAFEIIEDRGADYAAIDLPALIADNSWNAGIVLAPARPFRDIADLEGVLSIDGTAVDRGRSSDVLGHPLAAVGWLAAHLAGRGQTLKAGDWVMTGSIVPTRFPKVGERYRFALDGLPPVEAHIV